MVFRNEDTIYFKFAEELRKTLTDPPDVQVGSQEKVRPLRTGLINSWSTDYADVSWSVPSVSMTGATRSPSAQNGCSAISSDSSIPASETIW